MLVAAVLLGAELLCHWCLSEVSCLGNLQEPPRARGACQARRAEEGQLLLWSGEQQSQDADETEFLARLHADPGDEGSAFVIWHCLVRLLLVLP